MSPALLERKSALRIAVRAAISSSITSLVALIVYTPVLVSKNKCIIICYLRTIRPSRPTVKRNGVLCSNPAPATNQINNLQMIFD
jgi:hypothetical protein